MNLLVKKFRPLAAILLAATFAISCEDPGKIGLIVNANNGVISSHYQDIILETSVVQFDPRQTSDGQSIQTGQYFNPDFGLVTSISYSQLSLNIVIPPQDIAQYISFEAEMSFFSLMGDDPINNVTQSIGIYQLAEEIDTATNYTRLDQLATQPNPLGIWEFAPMRGDELKIDSSYIVPLDDNVGRDLFLKLKAGDEIYDSEGAFNAYFKGIALIPQGNTDIFQILPSRIIFRLKYNEFNSDQTAIERSYEMGLGDNGFYYIDSDKSGTPLSGLNPDNSDFFPTDDYRYLQFGTMIGIRVDLTPFYELTDTLENMIVNKAELSIGQLKEYPQALPPPAALRFYFTDSSTNVWPVIDDVGRLDTALAGNFFVMLQNEISLIPIPPGGYFAPLSTDLENNKYSVNMSAFFQNLYAGNFFSVSQPFLEQEAQIFIFGQSGINKPQVTETNVLTIPMAVHKDSIRLRIHYTVPNTQNQ